MYEMSWQTCEYDCGHRWLQQTGIADSSQVDMTYVIQGQVICEMGKKEDVKHTVGTFVVITIDILVKVDGWFNLE